MTPTSAYTNTHTQCISSFRRIFPLIIFTLCDFRISSSLPVWMRFWNIISALQHVYVSSTYRFKKRLFAHVSINKQLKNMLLLRLEEILVSTLISRSMDVSNNIKTIIAPRISRLKYPHYYISSDCHYELQITFYFTKKKKKLPEIEFQLI